MPRIQKITPCLWFAGNAEEAANHYVGIFPDSGVVGMSRYGEDMPLPEGTVLLIEFDLAGQRFQALNGTPLFRFSEAISMSVSCDTQQELDRYWEHLSAGGEEGPCGWLKDRFGLSWQIVPSMLGRMIQDPAAGRANRVLAALMRMGRLDIAALQRAYDGG